MARTWIQRIAGYTLAIGGLVWVLHDLEPRQLLAHLVIKDWRWAAAAVSADILAFLCQGWRWSLLLSPLGEVRTLRATQAIYAALFTNEVLPLHAGEIVRAKLVSRWLNVRFVAVLPSIAVERMLDGVWLALGIGTAAVFVSLPRTVETGADIFGVAVLASVAAFAYLVWRAGRTTSENGRFRFLTQVAASFRQIAAFGRLWPAGIISLMMIGLQTLSFWLVMPAYGLNLSFLAGAVVFFIVHIGTAIPNAPGNIGSFQFFTVLGLTLFGVDKAAAAGFSFVVFLVLTVPLWIIGFFAFTKTSLTFSELRRIRSLNAQH